MIGEGVSKTQLVVDNDSDAQWGLWLLNPPMLLMDISCIFTLGLIVDVSDRFYSK